MTQYNTLNVKLSNSQLDKLKLGIKNGTEVTLKLSSNVVGDYNDKNNFPHKLLLTNAHVLRLPKAFSNNSLIDTKLSITQLHKIVHSGGFSGPLQPLASSFLIPLGLPAAASATDAAILKKMFEFGRPLDLTPLNMTLLNSFEEMNDIMKMVKSLKESGLLIKALEKQLKMKQKNKNADFSDCY